MLLPWGCACALQKLGAVVREHGAVVATAKAVAAAAVSDRDSTAAALAAAQGEVKLLAALLATNVEKQREELHTARVDLREASAECARAKARADQADRDRAAALADARTAAQHADAAIAASRMETQRATEEGKKAIAASHREAQRAAAAERALATARAEAQAREVRVGAWCWRDAATWVAALLSRVVGRRGTLSALAVSYVVCLYDRPPVFSRAGRA